MTAVLVSRFLLDLQRTNIRSLNQDSTSASQMNTDTLRFDRVIGSLGGSILTHDAHEPSLDRESDSEDAPTQGDEPTVNDVKSPA